MSEHWLYYGGEHDPRHCAEINSATHFTPQPKTMGHWKFDENFRWNSTKRPRWLTRVMMKFLIEWEWLDEPTVSQPEPPVAPKP